MTKKRTLFATIKCTGIFFDGKKDKSLRLHRLKIDSPVTTLDEKGNCVSQARFVPFALHRCKT